MDQVRAALYTPAFLDKDPESIKQSVKSVYDTSAAFGDLDTFRNHKDYRQCIAALLIDIGTQEIRRDDIAAMLGFLIKYYYVTTDHTNTYVPNPTAYGRQNLLDELRESKDLCKAMLGLCTQAGYVTEKNQCDLATGLRKTREFFAQLR
jgi:hypothetical protein